MKNPFDADFLADLEGDAVVLAVPGPKLHQWKLSWPGNTCLRCGMDDPWESDEVPWVGCWQCKGATGAEECEDCKGQGSYPDPNYKLPPCIPETPEV